MSYRIDKWVINPKKNEFIRDHEVIRIESKAMQVLDFLVDRAGEIVSREELMKHVWTNVYVSEDTLTRCISILRKTFEDSPVNPKIIQTIKGEGYRIIAPVAFSEADPGSHTSKIVRLLAQNQKAFILLIDAFKPYCNNDDPDPKAIS